MTETLQVSELLERNPSQLCRRPDAARRHRSRPGSRGECLSSRLSRSRTFDAKLRARMRVEFKRLQRDYRATMLYVSHDQLEAMTMADRIVLINKGRVEQIAPPQELFDRPATLFAATFVGEPAMNVFDAKLLEQDGASVSPSVNPASRSTVNGWEMESLFRRLRTILQAFVPSMSPWLMPARQE